MFLSTCRTSPTVILVEMAYSGAVSWATVMSTTTEARLQMPVALGITKLRYVLNFRHLTIPSEAYVLQKQTASGLCLFTRACTCLSTVTPFHCSPAAHIAGGETCPWLWNRQIFYFQWSRCYDLCKHKQQDEGRKRLHLSHRKETSGNFSSWSKNNPGNVIIRVILLPDKCNMQSK